jgi:DNA ligase 1
MKNKLIIPTLYARGENDKVLEWTIEVEENKYRTITGAKGFGHVTSEWSECYGKNIGKVNETSDEQQAYTEALAKWKKKKEGGYFENIKDIDNQLFFSPQLAYNYNDYKDSINWKNGVYISSKLDGVRSIITKNGSSSRNGKPFVAFPHILNELKPLFEKYPKLILDGEVYTHKLNDNFNKIISLAKKSKPTTEDLEESKKYLQYWIFDCPSILRGFNERFFWIEETIHKLFGKDNKHIKICPHTLIKTSQEIEEHLQQYISEGYEGAMINTYDGLYEQKRSKNLLKYKEFKDEEFEVIDILEGVGNRSGIFGSAVLITKDNHIFNANSLGNEILYKELLINKNNYIGKTATVRYQNLTPDGVPRFPVVIKWSREDYE